MDATRAATELNTFLHPDYRYWREDWQLIRDSLAGERRVKEQGPIYLPPLDNDLGTSYTAYKARAVYVAMVARTVSGLVGTVFRRPTKVDNVKKELLKDVTLDGMDFNLFAKTLAWEVCSVGRVGVLVDMNDGRPYFSMYLAENILSWRTKMVNGREELTYVLLREILNETPALDGSVSPTPTYASSNLRARYRVLLLENGVYKQRVYDQLDQNGNPTFSTNGTYKEITPTRNGQAFDFIPMKIIGPLSPTPDIQKPPVLDIAYLNMAHYRTSAQLEHGRYFTAMPVYYVPVSNPEETGDYFIGAPVVWEVPVDTKPGILEYFGTGLSALALSLTEKEEHIAQLGGRIMGIRPQATSESDNIYALKQSNEMSILLNITESMSAGLTEALGWWLTWQREPTKDIRVTLNQDFKALQIGARELRAVALLYQSGILPIQEVHRILQESEMIGEEVSLTEFTEMLDNIENFPHQPDVESMREGYADSKERLKDVISKRETGLQAEIARTEIASTEVIEERKVEQSREAVETQAKTTKETAKMNAKAKAKAAPARPPAKK
jgi:hypothetical protein